jgi:uncharacterized protein YaeQ
MALKSIVFKAELQIADMDRNYYHTHSITIAKHPSETNERMMARVISFILHASQHLSFANGLTNSDEPDLWAKDLSGSIALWIMVGLPDKKQIKKACSRSEQVYIYTYNGAAADVWWASLAQGDKFTNLTVCNIPLASIEALAGLVQRTMKIQCSIQDGIMWLTSMGTSLEINVVCLKSSKNN